MVLGVTVRMASTVVVGAPPEGLVGEAMNPGNPSADDSQPVKRSTSHNNVLDLTDAAIATADTTHTGHGNDSTGEHGVNTASAVPSISLPRQSRDVKHFAMGKRTKSYSLTRMSRVEVLAHGTFRITVQYLPYVISDAYFAFLRPTQRLPFLRHGRLVGEDRVLLP